MMLCASHTRLPSVAFHDTFGQQLGMVGAVGQKYALTCMAKIHF